MLDVPRADALAAPQMTTGNAIINTIGALTATYKGTIVVHNEAHNQSATVQFKAGGGVKKSLGMKKSVKNGVGHLHLCPCTGSVLYRLDKSDVVTVIGRVQYFSV